MDDLFRRKSIERLFSKEDFTRLLHRATQECLRLAKEQYCEGPVPQKAQWLLGRDPAFLQSEGSLSILAVRIANLEQVLSSLRHEDGSHRADILVSPLGVTDNETIVQITWKEEWTKRPGSGSLPMGDFAPFALFGPTMTFDQARTKERIKLPRVTIK